MNETKITDVKKLSESYFPGQVLRSWMCVLVLMCGPVTTEADTLQRFDRLSNAGYIITDYRGQVLSSKNAQKSFIPASTTKLVTAWLALSHWGEDHRFSTAFYLDRNNSTLWIKAAGDPFLVSEELEIIANKIAALNPAKILQIALDVSVFESNLVVPGATVTNNPYDAIPTAIAANFNTIFLKKAGGKIVSAEPQTPLTPYALSFSKDITGTSLRINTGRQSKNSERYFAELLSSLLAEKGVAVKDEVSWGSFPDVSPDVIHYNSRTLGEIIKAMLKYSTNFIANQIMLALVAEDTQLPANFERVHQYMQTKLVSHFSWKDFVFYEGAGLSARNRISPNQLLELLQEFKLWRHLLPEVDPGIFAKTGTLTDVSTLAGFSDGHTTQQIFSIMINEKVPLKFSRQVAIELSGQ